MPLQVIDALSQAGLVGKANDDAYGASPQAVWVIDGATGLSKDKLTTADSDASWFAHRISTHLGDSLKTAQPLEDAAAYAMANTSRDLLDICKTLPANGVDLPCASGLIAQQNGDDIDIAFYGDCHLLALHPDGTLVHFGGDPVHEKIDADNIAEMANTRKEGESLADARARVIPLVIQGRLRANGKENSYPVWAPFAHEADCYAHAKRLHKGRFSAPRGTYILVMSDGFYRLVDVLQEMSPEHLVMAAKDYGLAPLIDHLRKLEEMDSEALSHPRLKAHDDATAVLAYVS